MILHLNSRKKSYIVYCLPICSYLSPWHVVAVQLELFPCPLCSGAWPRLLSHQWHVERVIWGATYPPKRVLLPCIPASLYLPPVCSHADKDDDLHAGADTGKIPVPAQLWRAEPPTPDLSHYSCHAPQKQTGSPHNNAPWGGESTWNSSSGFHLRTTHLKELQLFSTSDIQPQPMVPNNNVLES